MSQAVPGDQASVRPAGTGGEPATAVEPADGLAALLAALPVGVAIVDERGGSVQTNEHYRRIWAGVRPATGISDYAQYKAWWADSGEPVAPEEWASARAVLEGESVIGQILRIERFDGTTAFVHNSASPILDAAGRVVGAAIAIQDITDLREAEDALRRGKRLDEALNRINAAVHSCLGVDQVVQRLVEQGAAALGSQTAAISLRHEGGWLVKHVHGLPASIVGRRMEDEQERHAVLALAERRPVAVADALADERFDREHLRRHGIRSVLVVPLILRDEPFGVLFFNYHEAPHRFTPEEQDFARQLAATASIALDNARLFAEREGVERVLREGEAKLRIATASSGMVVFCQDRELRYTWGWNPHATFSGGDYLGRRDEDLLPPETAARLTDIKAGVLRTGEGCRHEVLLPLRGEQVWYDLTVEPVKDGQGQVEGILCGALDVTARKRVEAELRASRAQLEQELAAARQLQEISTRLIGQEDVGRLYDRILDAAVALMGSDFASIQRFCPERGEAGALLLLGHRGLPPRLVEESKWVGVDSAGTCAEAARTGRRVIAQDILDCELLAGTLTLEACRRSDIRAVQSTPLHARSGRLLGMLSTHWRRPHRPSERDLSLLDVLARQAADLMERAESRAALRQRESELRELNEQLEQRVRERTAELARRAAQLRALAGELSLSEHRERRRMAKLLHDHLQQLLVGAKFRTVMLGRSGDDIARQAAEEIEHLIDQCIGISRSLTAELSPPILHEGGLAASLAWLARWMADKHGLIVDLALEEPLPQLPEDVRILLFESLRELLFNAVKHARAGTAALNVRRIGTDRLRVTVSDNGPGFEPARLRPAGEAGGGFGLFSIRERLDFIGGSLEIDSAPGRGSRFMLTVPVAAEPPAVAPLAPPPEPATSVPEGRPAAPQPGSVLRVLLADDHVLMREGLGRLLGEEPDLEVVGQAADGAAAIELAARLLPDVILMDVSMPKLNGVEATRAIHREHPGIHIIGLSMFEEAERAQAMLEAGAVRYMSKSGPPADLVAAIRACILEGPPRG